MAKEQKVAVIAIGGNSLVNKGRESIDDQYSAVAETARHIADMIESYMTDNARTVSNNTMVQITVMPEPAVGGMYFSYKIQYFISCFCCHVFVSVKFYIAHMFYCFNYYIINIINLFLF